MLFFEYYTKYNSSPTEHQVFTSPPTERSIYFVHHHVLPLSVFIFQEHSSVSELMLQGSPRPLRCSRTLARPRSCSGTLARPRSCSGTHQTTSCSGTSRQTTSTTSRGTTRPRRPAELRPADHVDQLSFNHLDHSLTTAWGLRRSLLDLCSGTARPLSDHGSGTLRLDYMRLATRIQLGYFFSLRPCYKAHTSPSSKLGDYIGTMHLPVHLVSLVRRFVSQLNWEFFLDPGTTCLRHLLPGSGTKWAHFTLR